jgi:predicted transcriptional regulator
MRTQKMSKQQYRSELGIISDILCVTMDYGRQGAITSCISRRANLSHYAVLEKCQKLVDAGLVELISNNKNRAYVIKQKGIEFFQQIQKFREIANAVNIRY